jgi:hypothetical protein
VNAQLMVNGGVFTPDDFRDLFLRQTDFPVAIRDDHFANVVHDVHTRFAFDCPAGKAAQFSAN